MFSAVVQRMPAMFIGHGTPMNALETNRYAEAWQRAARAIPIPTPEHYLPLLYIPGLQRIRGCAVNPKRRY